MAFPFLILLVLFFTGCAGKNDEKVQARKWAAQLDSVIWEGNSEKAFELVRNMYGIPASDDAFLHFKPLGIDKLLSYCNLMLRRVEATSLIKYNQADSFWTNYSQQFTAGEWNYKTLFKSDSAAVYGANYAIILVYAHEVGHYLSSRCLDYREENYTCEEVLANECLAAFANVFNGIDKFDQHKENFLNMARQTYEAMPDSVKTSFSEKTTDWCTPNPMKAFFDDYFTNEPKFLRLYGYSQLRMMENAIKNHNGQGWNDFLQTRFFKPFAEYNNTDEFEPAYYTIINEELLPPMIAHSYQYNKNNSAVKRGYIVSFSNANYSIDATGNAYECFPYKEPVTDPGKQWISQYGVSLAHIVFKKAAPDTLLYVTAGQVSDTASDCTVFLNSTVINAEAAYSLISFVTKKLKPAFIGKKIQVDNMWDADSSTWETKLVKTYLGNKPARVITLPDTRLDTARYCIHEETLCINGANGHPLLLNNMVENSGKKQLLRLSNMHLQTLKTGNIVFETELPSSGYMETGPVTFYHEDGSKEAIMAFASPVTEKVYVIHKNGKQTRRFELFNKSINNPWGEQMQVSAIQLIAPDKMYILATCRKAGNSSEKIVRKLLIRWDD